MKTTKTNHSCMDPVGFGMVNQSLGHPNCFWTFCMKIKLPTISSPRPDRLCWKPSWWDFHRPICLIILNSCNLTCHNCTWKNEKGSYNPALFAGNTPPQKLTATIKNWKLVFERGCSSVLSFLWGFKRHVFSHANSWGINSSLGNVVNLRELQNSAWNSMKTLR